MPARVEAGQKENLNSPADAERLADLGRFRAVHLRPAFSPTFSGVDGELQKFIEIAWDDYDVYRKNPRTRWREAVRQSQVRYARRMAGGPPRDSDGRALAGESQFAAAFLLGKGSSRSDQSCPGEISKMFRLNSIAKRMIGCRGEWLHDCCWHFSDGLVILGPTGIEG